MSAGDCEFCGGDGFLPGSLGASPCPRCGGDGNLRRSPFWESPHKMLWIIIALLAAIGVSLLVGCGVAA